MKVGGIVWGKELSDSGIGEIDKPFLIVDRDKLGIFQLLNLVSGELLRIDVVTMIDLNEAGLIKYEYEEPGG